MTKMTVKATTRKKRYKSRQTPMPLLMTLTLRLMQQPAMEVEYECDGSSSRHMISSTAALNDYTGRMILHPHL